MIAPQKSAGSAAPPGFTGGLMEAIVARDYLLKKALAQVKRNKGRQGSSPWAAGPRGMAG
jgi:hypothetical protein